MHQSTAILTLTIFIGSAFAAAASVLDMPQARDRRRRSLA